MKFYLCQTPNGPEYARTQAEAKALDPKFELVEYPTDQAALVQRFNELLRAAPPAGIRINGESATADDVAAIGRALDDEDGGYPEPPVKPRTAPQATSATDWGLPPPPGSCPRCEAMSAASRNLDDIMAATNIEWTLQHADADFIDRIGVAVEDRRAQLADG